LSLRQDYATRDIVDAAPRMAWFKRHPSKQVIDLAPATGSADDTEGQSSRSVCHTELKPGPAMVSSDLSPARDDRDW
jgi:hypothetical protein